MKPRRLFTPAEDSVLLAMAKRGKSPSCIARTLDRSYSAVAYRLSVLLDQPRPGTDAARKGVDRNCLRCGSRFKSEGCMNRLCGRCRSAVAGLPSQFEGVAA